MNHRAIPPGGPDAPMLRRGRETDGEHRNGGQHALERTPNIRWRSVGYWIATTAIAVELGLGGIWDIARIPSVLNLIEYLGYPSYFLVLLGTWKVFGAVALLVPGRRLIKEWAYAGVFFTYTGAIASHLITGYDVGEVAVLALLTALTVLSWTLRPRSRRVWQPASSELP